MYVRTQSVDILLYLINVSHYFESVRTLVLIATFHVSLSIYENRFKIAIEFEIELELKILKKAETAVSVTKCLAYLIRAITKDLMFVVLLINVTILPTGWY